MAINLTSKATQSAGEFLGLLNMPTHVYEWLAQSDVTVKLLATEILFAAAGFSVKVNLTLSTITAIKEGTCNPDVKESVRAAVIDAVDKLKGVVGTVIKEKPATLNKLPPLMSQPVADAEAPAAPAPGLWPRYPLDKMETGERVKLAKATRMYQPVHATSSDSRYFVVAGNGKIKVAARYHGHALAIRVEGPGLASHQAHLMEVGFNAAYMSKGYTSMHMHVDNDVLAAKTLGAIIMGLGISLETELPNIEILKGKGC